MKKHFIYIVLFMALIIYGLVPENDLSELIQKYSTRSSKIDTVKSDFNGNVKVEIEIKDSLFRNDSIYWLPVFYRKIIVIELDSILEPKEILFITQDTVCIQQTNCAIEALLDSTIKLY